MKVPQGLSRAEQETFFRCDGMHECWEFYSRDPVFKRKLESRGYTVTEDHQGLWACKLPMHALTIRSHRAVTAIPTEEQRQKRVLSGKSLHAAAAKSKAERKDDHRHGENPNF